MEKHGQAVRGNPCTACRMSADTRRHIGQWQSRSHFFLRNTGMRSCPGTILVYTKNCRVGVWGGAGVDEQGSWKLGRGRTRSTRDCREQSSNGPATSSEMGSHH